MEPRLLIALMILPFAVIFGSCMWHELRRFRQQGRAAYGLSYDEETDSTHVVLLSDDETGYDPQDTTAAKAD